MKQNKGTVLVQLAPVFTFTPADESDIIHYASPKPRQQINWQPERQRHSGCLPLLLGDGQWRAVSAQASRRLILGGGAEIAAF
jgi:hypothetical protein